MPLTYSAGHASETGPRPKNDDFCGMTTPSGAELDGKGALFALADGISGEAGGREAAEYTVRGLLADYYATPDTWETAQALDKIVQAGNRWLLAHAAAHRDLAGMATTLSALVLRRRRFVVAHVGDSRVYRLRDGRLEQLTVDHVWDHPDMRHVLRRAVGLDHKLAIDFVDGELATGDVFVIVCDGVWEPLGDGGLRTVLRETPEPEAAARALVATALATGGQDNASALVVRVDGLPDESLPESLAASASLPVPPRLKPGQGLDAFVVRDVLHTSRATLLYKAELPATGQTVVIKTLAPEAADDANACAALLAEEWLAKRVVSHYLPQVLPCPERTALYYAMSWHEGATLQQKLDAGWHFSVADTVQLGIRLLKGLAALHKRNIIHRDIKPANLHAGADGRLRILDLGVALNLGGMHDAGAATAANPGTPSFMAPELLAGEPASVRSDLYAAGVTLYHLLTRRYPYGEVEPFQHPRFGEPAAPTRYRPEVPEWLENVLLKACAREPGSRFETAEEFLLALENAARRPLERPRPAPLLARARSLARWKLIAVASIVLNLILLVLFFGMR